MPSHSSDHEIFITLSSILVQALRVDSGNIKMESRIFLDLNAESLDVLDIQFRIEQAFGFKVGQNGLIRSLDLGLNATEIEERFTVRSLIEYIRNKLPKVSEL